MKVPSRYGLLSRQLGAAPQSPALDQQHPPSRHVPYSSTDGTATFYAVLNAITKNAQILAGDTDIDIEPVSNLGHVSCPSPVYVHKCT